MNKILKALGKFFTSKAVHLWGAIMLAVIIVVCSGAAWIMIADKVVYGKLKYTSIVRDPETNIVTSSVVRFDFVPHLHMIDTITISNNNDELFHDTPELNNNKIGGIDDPVPMKSEAKAVAEIMKRLNSGRRTNTFKQFFSRGDSGPQRVSSTFVGSWQFEDLSEGIWIKITFATPEFVVIRTDNNPYEIQTYNPAYTRHFDEARGTYVGPTVNQYNRSVVNAIHIPLGSIKNKFTEQTWYLSVGSATISNTTSIGYTFTTYGNYHSLARYIQKIDDDFLL